MRANRVLVVEDEPLVAMALDDILSEAGFVVVLASNAALAITALEAECESIDAVVTDIRMPGALSGWHVGKRARELKADMPVIYCSGDKAADWSLEGVPNSIMLRKPFAMSQLVTAVIELTHESSSSYSARPSAAPLGPPDL